MPQPVTQQLHVDRYLTNVAIAWSQEQANFVADKIFPVVPVNKESDFYAVYNRAYFYRDEMQVRPLGGRPPEAGYEVTHQRYNCVEWGLEDKIDDRIRQNADQPLDPDMAAMRLLTTQALIHRDKLWQEAFFKAGVWKGQKKQKDFKGKNTGVTSELEVEGTAEFVQFDKEQTNGQATGNVSGTEPIGFIEARRLEVAESTGYQPNVLVLGAHVWRVLKNHPAIIERIKYTQRGIVTTDIMASLFDVDRVVVPLSVINTEKETLPSATAGEKFEFIVSPRNMLLVYAAPAPSIQAPSGGYTFAYTGLVPGVTNAFGGVIERGREELAHSDVIQIRASYTQVATATSLGIFFENCTST